MINDAPANTSFNRPPNGPRVSSHPLIFNPLIRRLTVVVATLWCFAFFCRPSACAAERPNILLIVSEDNGPELGCYGDPFVKTPVLDQLAADGVRFHNSYVPQAGCSQSRAALWTGLYPHPNGQFGRATWKLRMYRHGRPTVVSRWTAGGSRTVGCG